MKFEEDSRQTPQIVNIQFIAIGGRQGLKTRQFDMPLKSIILLDLPLLYEISSLLLLEELNIFWNNMVFRIYYPVKVSICQIFLIGKSFYSSMSEGF